MSVGLTQCQYRTLIHTYLFKEKDANSLSIKIYDLSHKCLWKKIINKEDLDKDQVQQAFANKNGSALWTILAMRNVLSKEYQGISKEKGKESQNEDLDTAEEIRKIATLIKPKILKDDKLLEQFICPITHQVPQNPCMDDDGHTFEKEAIEEHMKKNGPTCPISRNPISKLTPNFAIKQALEHLQKQDPIPSFALFKGENKKLAMRNLEMAATYIHEEEYSEALEALTKAFAFSKDWRDYIALPDLYVKMKLDDNAALAYLYLAQYQLEDKKIDEAIESLKKCAKIYPKHFDLHFVCLKLSIATNAWQHVTELAQDLVSAFKNDNLSANLKEKTISILEEILKDKSAESNFSSLTSFISSQLASLYSEPFRKAHVLLKGACHALEREDYTTSQGLWTSSQLQYTDSFVDQLVYMDLMEKSKKPGIKEELLNIAQLYEKRGLLSEALKAYKAFFQLEYSSQYFQKILDIYAQLKKPAQTSLRWSLSSLATLMEKKDWENAEKVIIAATHNAKANGEDPIPFYEKLEFIYDQSKSPFIKDVLGKLGAAYASKGRLAEAEKTYRKAFQLFPTFDHAFGLAEALREEKKISESVATYYSASEFALIDNLEGVELCVQKIQQIDPQFQYLNPNQKTYLLTQRQIQRLSQELHETKQELKVYKETISLTPEINLSNRELKYLELQFVLPFCTIKKLNLSHCQLGNLSFLTNLLSIEELILNDFKLDYDGWYNQDKYFTKLAPTLKKLDMSATTCDTWLFISKLTNLVGLNLSMCKQVKEHCFYPPYSLTDLDLSNTNSANISSVFNLKLTKLTVDKCKIPHEQFEKLPATLKTLSIAETSFSKQNTFFLTKLTNLEKLNMSRCDLTNPKSFPSTLMWLNLSHNPITDLSFISDLPRIEEVRLIGIKGIQEQIDKLSPNVAKKLIAA